MDPYGFDVAIFPSPELVSEALGLDVSQFAKILPAFIEVLYNPIYIYLNCPGTYYTGFDGDCTNLVLQWRGYVRASTSGTYTFQIPPLADDREWLWLGSTAYSGYNTTNYAAQTSYDNANATGTATVYAEAGTYIPWRVLYAQHTYVALASLTVIAPDGTLLMNPQTRTSQLANVSSEFVEYSCSNRTAPPFLPWGQET